MAQTSAIRCLVLRGDARLYREFLYYPRQGWPINAQSAEEIGKWRDHLSDALKVLGYTTKTGSWPAEVDHFLTMARDIRDQLEIAVEACEARRDFGRLCDAVRKLIDYTDLVLASPEVAEALLPVCPPYSEAELDLMPDPPPPGPTLTLVLSD